MATKKAAKMGRPTTESKKETAARIAALEAALAASQEAVEAEKKRADGAVEETDRMRRESTLEETEQFVRQLGTEAENIRLSEEVSELEEVLDSVTSNTADALRLQMSSHATLIRYSNVLLDLVTGKARLAKPE